MTNYKKKKIRLTFPEEMELKLDPQDVNHFGIRPVKNDVEPAKFRQMLRCLPWMKIYTYEDVNKAKGKKQGQ